MFAPLLVKTGRTPCAVRGAAAPKEKSDLHQIAGIYRDIYDLLTAHHFFSFFTRPARLGKTLTCSIVHVKCFRSSCANG